MNSFKICGQFGVEIVAQKDIVKGLINNTSLVTTRDGKKYILQEINSNVFKDVDKLMNNIDMVTEHLKKKIVAENGNPSRETLNLLKSDGKSYVTTKEADGKIHYYRMYDYIDNATSFDQASKELLYHAGVGFGRFQRQLADFPADKLTETIPDFHNTAARYQQFLDAVNHAKEQGDFTTLIKAKQAMDFAFKNEAYSKLLSYSVKSGNIPLRVVHNDTKLNNVMLDNDTHEPVCVIDLDTIMPGSMLYDYGDAIRYGANTGLEDDVNLKNVKIDMEKFTAFTEGFLKETAKSITPSELNFLPYAPMILAYELGLRFLTDYLNGNKYFRCDSHRPDHNLERARAQFKLMHDMKRNLPQMKKIVNDIYSKNISAPIQ